LKILDDCQFAQVCPLQQIQLESRRLQKMKSKNKTEKVTLAACGIKVYVQHI